MFIRPSLGLLNVVMRPLLLKITIETVARLAESRSSSGDGSSGSDDADSNDDTLTSVLLVFAIGGSLVVEGLVAAASKHYLSDQLGTAVFGKTAALIQRKSINLKSAAAVQPSTLIGSDLVRFYESTKMLSLVPMCVTGVLGGPSHTFAISF